MYQSQFNPVTYEMEISLSEKTSLDRWADILKYYFNMYAQEIAAADKTYIGHIKVLALINENTSFKLSIFKSSIPAEVDITGEAFIDKISLLVNSFVYGVDEIQSSIILGNIAKKMEKEFLLTTTFRIKHEHHH